MIPDENRYLLKGIKNTRDGPRFQLSPKQLEIANGLLAYVISPSLAGNSGAEY